MGRKAILSSTVTTRTSREERETRKAVEAAWRRGNLKDYSPICLTGEGLKAFETIANALPEEALSTVDGYTIEVAANALTHMIDANEHILAEGQVVERVTNAGVNTAVNPYIQVYARYADIFKRYLVELGCTPSARSKIANDVAKKTRPQGVYDVISDG